MNISTMFDIVFLIKTKRAGDGVQRAQALVSRERALKTLARAGRAVARGDVIGAARAGSLTIITVASRHGSAATDRDAEVTGRRRNGTNTFGHISPPPLVYFSSPTRHFPPHPVDSSLAMGFRSMSSPPPPNVKDFL